MKTLEERTKEYVAYLKDDDVKVKGWEIDKSAPGGGYAHIYIDDWVIHGSMVSNSCVVSAIDGKIRLTLFDK